MRLYVTLQHLKIKEKADAITSHFDVFNHILKKRDLQKAFGNVYTALNEGGIFIFDLIWGIYQK